MLPALACSISVPMRFSMTELRDKALLSLDEAYEEALKGPIAKSKHLSFTLAFLSRFTDDDAPFIQFWREATNPAISDNTSHQFGRRQCLMNARAVIYRGMGLEAPD